MKKPFPLRSTRSGSEGLRITQEIATIQRALNQQPANLIEKTS